MENVVRRRYVRWADCRHRGLVVKARERDDSFSLVVVPPIASRGHCLSLTQVRACRRTRRHMYKYAKRTSKPPCCAHSPREGEENSERALGNAPSTLTRSATRQWQEGRGATRLPRTRARACGITDEQPIPCRLEATPHFLTFLWVAEVCVSRHHSGNHTIQPQPRTRAHRHGTTKATKVK